MQRDRRSAFAGLGRILDAGGLEDLFAGPDDEAAYLYELLGDVARGRESSVYGEICRTARRRHVTPEYVADRAAVFRAAIDQRRRTDLYRILGVRALAPAELLRQRWIDFVHAHHPDVGGDAARFRRVKEAWDVLRDPRRRAEYERFWVRALGPFERVAADEAADHPPLPRAAPPSVDRPTPAPEPASLADRDPLGVARVREQLEAMLAQVDASTVERLRAEIESTAETLRRLRDALERIADAKRKLPD